MKHVWRTAVAAIALLAFSTIAHADEELEFEARLSGDQEVPGVATRTSGKLKIDFDIDFTEADFRLRVKRGRSVTQAHLHCGPAGQNGPVVAFLFGFVTGGVDVDGTLSKGTLTNDDIITRDCGGAEVNNIASLAFAALAGQIYVNVHTVANPPGEVRGQLVLESLADN